MTPDHARGLMAKGGGDAPAALPAPRAVRERVSRRVVSARVATALAALLVVAALVMPNDFAHFTPAAFLTLPVEALLGVLVVLALPGRARTVAAIVAGVVLGLLTILKLLDLTFGVVLARPFDPLSDWPLLGAGQEFLAESFGTVVAVVVAVVIVAVAAALPVLMALAILRLSRAVVRRRVSTARVVAVLAVAWVALAAFRVQVEPGVPVSGWNTSAAAYSHAEQIWHGLADQRAFAQETAVDAYRDTPRDRLLTGLHGKDVIVVFVESYGRDAIEKPGLARQVDAVLDGANRRLAAAGFAARSGFLTSPTVGGSSWLAHATFQSGLRIDNQRRYTDFNRSDRFTLVTAFKRVGWRTVHVAPANTGDWPEGRVYGYDMGYDAATIGYQGPLYAFSSVPDQFTLASFQQHERQPGHPPVMAEIDLLSSHAPWAPVPPLVDWDAIGDGSGYQPPITGAADSPHWWRRDVASLRADYQRSIEYSLRSVVSFVERYGDHNTVLLVLGDHQPSPVITGRNASSDVPIAIIARDPAVLDRIVSWGWQPGLNPDPDAPVWPMDAFRDRFLAAYGPDGR